MTESGYHRHHASAIVIGSESPDRLGVFPRVKGVPGISLGRRDGIDMGIEDQGLFRSIETAADCNQIAPFDAVGQIPFIKKGAEQLKHPFFFERRGGDAYHLPEQSDVFAVIFHHIIICVPPSFRRASEFLITTSAAPS